MYDVLTIYDLTFCVPTHRSDHTLDLIITRCNHELLLSNPVADYMVPDHMFVVSYQVNMSRPTLKGHIQHSRQIILQFKDYKCKDEFVKARTVLRAKRPDMFISEDHAQGRVKVLHTTRTPKRHHKIMDWRVFIKDLQEKKIPSNLRMNCKDYKHLLCTTHYFFLTKYLIIQSTSSDVRSLSITL